MKMVCKICGSEEMQIMAWVDINSKKLTEIPAKTQTWCDDCCNHTKPVDKQRYENNKK